MNTKTYHRGWNLEVARNANGRWVYALDTGPWVGQFRTAALARKAAKARVDEVERQEFRRRVWDALYVVGLCTPGDWRWLRGKNAILLMHGPDERGLRVADDAVCALSAYMLRDDPWPDDERVRGGTRVTFREG